MKRSQTSYKLVSLAYKLSLWTSLSSSNALRHRLMSKRKVLTPLHKPTTMVHALIIQNSAPTHPLFLSPRSSYLAAGRASVKNSYLARPLQLLQLTTWNVTCVHDNFMLQSPCDHAPAYLWKGGSQMYSAWLHTNSYQTRHGGSPIQCSDVP